MTSILPPDGSITSLSPPSSSLSYLGSWWESSERPRIGIGAAIAIIIVDPSSSSGFLTPNQVIQPLVQLVRSGPSLTSKVSQVAGYLPYSSITFIVGFVIGFFKG